MYFVIVILFLLLLVFIIWCIGFVYSNDFSVSSKSVKRFQNILFIFPHADDEVFTAGGLISVLSKMGKHVTLVLLTKGEKGTDDAHTDLNLKPIRTKETETVAQLLQVKRLIQEDFGDGELVQKKTILKTYITNVLRTTKPDLVVTYDLAGLYGHDDHIVCSEIITAYCKTHAGAPKLWYASLPKRMLAMTQLPEHMANDPSFAKKRVPPTHKIFLGFQTITKIRAMYRYRSQLQSFRKSMPIPGVPLWFFYSMWPYEYFHEVK